MRKSRSFQSARNLLRGKKNRIKIKYNVSQFLRRLKALKITLHKHFLLSSSGLQPAVSYYATRMSSTKVAKTLRSCARVLINKDNSSNPPSTTNRVTKLIVLFLKQVPTHANFQVLQSLRLIFLLFESQLAVHMAMIIS